MKSTDNKVKTRMDFPVAVAVLAPFFLALAVTQLVQLARADPHMCEKIPQVASTLPPAITMFSPDKSEVFALCR